MTIFITIFITCLLFLIPNQSNLPTFYTIPVLAALLTKYCLGDWDFGFQWTFFDILYWTSVLGTSMTTLHFLMC